MIDLGTAEKAIFTMTITSDAITTPSICLPAPRREHQKSSPAAEGGEEARALSDVSCKSDRIGPEAD